MCGICGIWGGGEIYPVEEMIRSMRHRGPNDQGIFSDSQVTLGMTRLSILDLSESGHQPMSNPDGTIWIVYNGEVYNYREERQKLETKGYSFISSSDTEVVLKLYEAYGIEFLPRLRGMFALAIYDKRQGPGKERLILARDPIGIKPLLYSIVGHRIIFASEIKALISSGQIHTDVDPEGLRLLLTYGSIIQPRTILSEVKMLQPAHRMVVENNCIRQEQYWKFRENQVPGLQNLPYEDLVDEVGRTLKESVKHHLVSDVPVGAFLSGGVDSSLTVSLMSRIAGQTVKTFSIGFGPEGKEIDESNEAERTAKFLGVDHTRVVIHGDQVRDQICQIASGLDQPSIDGVNSFYISQAARENVSVAISGTGGDELFAGYPWFTEMVRYENKFQRNSLRAVFEDLLSDTAGWSLFDGQQLGGQLKVINSIRNHSGFLANYANTYFLFGVSGAAKLLSPEMKKAAQVGRSMARDIRLLDELPKSGAVNRVTALCLRGYTNNQLLRDIDATSMAHSLEIRVPFLDIKMVDLVLSLPQSVKIGNLDQTKDAWKATYRESGCKRILIDAGRKLKLLPPEIDMQPKRGFGMPFDYWLRGPMKEIVADTLSNHTVQKRGWLDVSVVDAIHKEFLQGTTSWAGPWLLMMIELWAREALDHRQPVGIQ